MIIVRSLNKSFKKTLWKSKSVRQPRDAESLYCRAEFYDGPQVSHPVMYMLHILPSPGMWAEPVNMMD